MNEFQAYKYITIVSMKMYFRNRRAIVWALFFPLLIMIIFGVLNFDRFNPPDVGLVDNADNAISKMLTEALRGDQKKPLINLTLGSQEDLIEQLEDGGLDAVFVIPMQFGETEHVSTVSVLVDERRPQQTGVAKAVLGDSMEALFRETTDIPEVYKTENRFELLMVPTESRGQGFKGFLVPGIASMAIMQAGIFGVVFTLIRFRSQGVLRRLFATPIGPQHFLVGQVLTRLTVAVAQAFILLIAGTLLLGVTVVGGLASWLTLGLFSVVGGALFITIGFAISGWAKSEEVAAPVSNIIAMPMMLLSGVFFPTEMLPDAMGSIIQFLPLTYLADGMRAVATEGAGISEVVLELTGLILWTAIAFGISTRVFRWE